MDLSQKHCVACRKGTPAFTAKKAQSLLAATPGWTISDDGKWLVKAFKFKNFAQSLAFANKIGAIAEEENHHPDIMFGWGYANVRLQTHAADGLHENDFILAAKINKLQ